MKTASHSFEAPLSLVLAASCVGGMGCGANVSEAGSLSEPLTGGADVDAFVRVVDDGFFLRGRPYRFLGVNYWQAMNLASSGPGGDRARLRADLDALANRGLRNLRIMAASEGPTEEPYRIVPALQPELGAYDPKILEGLDFLLGELAARDMKAVLCLGNFWHWSGGFAQYVQWSTDRPIPYPSDDVPGSWDAFGRYSASFYKDAAAVAAYRAHVERIVGRRNALTGRAYRDDATIMAWELANEPRGMGVVKHFRDWIDDTATLIKSLDPNHLVTTGTEGAGPVPESNGLDFVRDHLSASIDYATVHLWVENWGWYDPAVGGSSMPRALSEASRYLEEHRRLASWLGKPVVLEEFGMARDEGAFDPTSPTSQRDSFFNSILKWATDPDAGEPFAGANIWAWAGEGRPLVSGGPWQPGHAFTGDPPHEPQGWYGVYATDMTTLAILERHARSLSGSRHR